MQVRLAGQDNRAGFLRRIRGSSTGETQMTLQVLAFRTRDPGTGTRDPARPGRAVRRPTGAADRTVTPAPGAGKAARGTPRRARAGASRSWYSRPALLPPCPLPQDHPSRNAPTAEFSDFCRDFGNRP